MPATADNPFEPMRILAITNLYPNPLQPHRGAFNRQQFRALAQRHDVRVIAPIAWTDERKARQKAGAPSIPENRKISFDGLEVHHPRYWFPPRIGRGLYGRCFLRSIRAAYSTMPGFTPDVILAAWAYPDGWAAVEFGRRLKIPVVVKVHGSDILTLADVPGRSRGTRLAMSGADAVIAVSRDLAAKVTAMGAAADRVTVIYDGIDAEKFRPGPCEDSRKIVGLENADRVLLFVGNLLPVKGVDLLIEACAQLKSRGEQFLCCMIGDGPLRGELAHQIVAKNLTDCVRLVGSVAHAQLPDWFRAADVFILPSRSEGVPCVLLEAAACQTPFVATRVGGIPEIAALNTGKVIESENATAVADAVIEVLGKDRRAVPAYSRTHEDAARDIESLLESVCLRSTASPNRETTRAGLAVAH